MNKKIIFSMIALTILTVYCKTVLAQGWISLLQKQQANSKPLDLWTIEKAFNDYWAPKNVQNGYYYENGIKTKAAGWKLFQRWKYYWEQRVSPMSGEFANTNSLIEYNKSINKLRKTTTTLSSASWVNLGTNSSQGGYAGIGRINCIAFHPTDPNTYWVGSPSGGIWKTTDIGAHWTILNNNMPVLGVSDIAVPSDYALTNTLYIATGDRDWGYTEVNWWSFCR